VNSQDSGLQKTTLAEWHKNIERALSGSIFVFVNFADDKDQFLM
jgi:hypothetical protein